MLEKPIILPFYAKACFILVGLIAFISILYIGQGIIVPLIFSTIIAILLQPIVKFIDRFLHNRIISISIIIMLSFILIFSIATFILSQASSFVDSWPLLVTKFTALLNQMNTVISGYLNINTTYFQNLILHIKSDLISSSSVSIKNLLLSIGNSLMVLLLVPVYVFIILLYHQQLNTFIHLLFSSSNQKNVSEVITQIKVLIQHYLVGLVIEATIITTLYTITLFALGIEYAILLGIIGALLNLIPYIGGLVGVALPMIVALVTKSSAWYAIYILIIYYLIQLIDNNYLVPKVVASKVKINALFSIIIVIAGNQLWGVSGMFLAIPLLAIIKLIFDHVNQLKPWGYLLGDEINQSLSK